MPVTFTAEISGPAINSNVVYNWTVSAGVITGGQGTSSIVIDTTGLSEIGYIKATVETKGFSELWPKIDSCSVAIASIHHPHYKIDEYGNIKFNDEKARLDNFSIHLENEPTVQGYLICYGGRIGRVGEAQRRCARAKNDLVTRRMISADRIVTLNGGYRESMIVELWAIPSGLTPPAPSPTVDPHEVKTIRSKPKRRARRR
jgi:hypothetical protein